MPNIKIKINIFLSEFKYCSYVSEMWLPQIPPFLYTNGKRNNGYGITDIPSEVDRNTANHNLDNDWISNKNRSKAINPKDGGHEHSPGVECF